MPIPFNPKIEQIAIVVKDIESARKNFAALLGVEPPEIVTTSPGSEVGQIYRGKPSNSQAKLAFFDMGVMQLELIEPMGKDNAWAEGLEEKGDRVHHIAFWTEDMKAATQYLGEHGAPMIMRGDFNDHSGEYAYFDAQAQFGCLIELLGKKPRP